MLLSLLVGTTVGTEIICNGDALPIVTNNGPFLQGNYTIDILFDIHVTGLRWIGCYNVTKNKIEHEYLCSMLMCHGNVQIH